MWVMLHLQLQEGHIDTTWTDERRICNKGSRIDQAKFVEYNF